MKSSLKFAVITLVMLCSTNVFGQIENIKMTSDSSLVLDKVYIGALGMSGFSTDSAHVSGYVNLRVGAIIHWDIVKWLTLNAFYMYQAETKNSWGLNQFSVKIAPCKKWNIQIGNMASISTQQRPHPVSAGGQFETWTEAQIPGGGLGAKTTYSPNKNLSFGLGVVARQLQPEYHANINYKKLTLSGYYGTNDQKAGMAFTYAGNNAWTTLVWKQDKLIANTFGCKLSNKYNILMYSNIGYDLETKDLVSGEWGVYVNFTAKHCSVLPCIGYNYETRTVRGYLFIHL